jgi:hypothetical protein
MKLIHVKKVVHGQFYMPKLIFLNLSKFILCPIFNLVNIIFIS